MTAAPASHRNLIVMVAARHKLPAVYPGRSLSSTAAA